LNFTSFKSFFPGIWFSLTRLKFSLLRKLYFQKADIFSFLVYINYSTTCVYARKYLRGNTVKCLCQAILTHYKSFLTFEWSRGVIKLFPTRLVRFHITP
jgi:hypothetical protein